MWFTEAQEKGALEQIRAPYPYLDDPNGRGWGVTVRLRQPRHWFSGVPVGDAKAIDMSTYIIRYTEPGKSHMTTQVARRSVKIFPDGMFNIDQAQSKYRELVEFYAEHLKIQQQISVKQMEDMSTIVRLKEELGMTSEDMLFRSRVVYGKTFDHDLKDNWGIQLNGLTYQEVQAAMRAINLITRNIDRARASLSDDGLNALTFGKPTN